MRRILLVEDEAALCMTLGDRLRGEGYGVHCAGDGNDGFAEAVRTPFDLIILDVMLPGRDGFDVCRGLREAGLGTPILMLTARGQTAYKVRGLRIGADDYLTKPFDMRELIARVEALIRRAPDASGVPSGIYRFGAITVDVRGTTVTRDGAPVSLSAREFQLLQFFLLHPGATLSREELLTRVWGYRTQVATRTVDVHVASLRQKLEARPRRPAFFLTVQGLGYKFEPGAADA